MARDIDGWERVWDAYTVRDSSRLTDVCDPEIEWHTRFPGMPSVFHGYDGLLQFEELVMQAIDMYPVLIRAIEIDDSQLFIHSRIGGPGVATGAEASMEIYDIWTLRRGRLLRREVYYDRAEALAVAGLDPGALDEP
jgi:ketosteroid isomerase-like protein